MKNLSILCAVLVLTLVGCEWSSRFAPPPVTPQMANATKGARRNEHVDLATLNDGRKLFVSRCIECHTLPPFYYYSNKDWPGIIDSMAHRASLKQSERDAVLAYILAARRK